MSISTVYLAIGLFQVVPLTSYDSGEAFSILALLGRMRSAKQPGTGQDTESIQFNEVSKYYSALEMWTSLNRLIPWLCS